MQIEVFEQDKNAQNPLLPGFKTWSKHVMNTSKGNQRFRDTVNSCNVVFAEWLLFVWFDNKICTVLDRNDYLYI